MDLLIFDMDGVLVDVAESYRVCVAQTVRTYVRDVARPDPGADVVISPEAIAAWKSAGGFNNDWDLSAGLAGAVLCGGDPVALAGAIGEAGGGLAGLEAVMGRVATAAVRYNGDLGDPHDIKRIFQELYLGGARFKATVGLIPCHVPLEAEGLCDRERPILSPAATAALAALRPVLPLAIATGRPADEARDALKRLDAQHVFSVVVTDDDVRAESRRTSRPFEELAKPSPWPLQEAHRRAAATAERPAYIGDLADDMAAAAAAQMFAIGVGDPAPEGASLALAHPDELVVREATAG